MGEGTRRRVGLAHGRERGDEGIHGVFYVRVGSRLPRASSAAAPRAGYSSSADEKAARLKAQQDAFKAKLAAQGATVASASPSSNSFSFGGGGGTSEPTAEEIARAEKKREQKAIYKAAMEKAKAGRVDGPGLAGTGIFKAPF